MKNNYQNPYINYYNYQVGTGLTGYSGIRFQRGYGLPGYAGIRYQRGHGFFGRVFSWLGNFVKDLAPKVAKRALPSAIGFAQDVVEGQNVGQSAKKRLVEAGRNVGDETLDFIKTKIQKGSGIQSRKRKYSMLSNYTMRSPHPKKRRKVNIRKRSRWN